jgi:hypothetical protein
VVFLYLCMAMHPNITSASCAKDGGCRSLASRTDTVTSPHDADVMLGYRLAVYSVLRIDVDGRV